MPQALRMPHNSKTLTVTAPDLILPDRFLLSSLRGPKTTASDAQFANWPLYSYAIQSLLRANGLSAHLASPGSGPGPGSGAPPAERRRWEREDEVCKALIALNVRYFEAIVGPRLGQSAGALWGELCAMAGVDPPGPEDLDVDEGFEVEGQPVAPQEPAEEADGRHAGSQHEKTGDKDQKEKEKDNGEDDGRQRLRKAFEDAWAALLAEAPRLLAENERWARTWAERAVWTLVALLGLVFVLVLVAGSLFAQLGVWRQAALKAGATP